MATVVNGYTIEPEADLSGAELRSAYLTGADLNYADLTLATLNDAELTDANLSNANLSYARLNGASLSDADLSYADLTIAELSMADLSYADLSYADLSGADLIGANLTVADLIGANLTNADLTAADLSDAHLHAADLHAADLTGADLTDADLTGADLTDAYLTGADLTRANIYKATGLDELTPDQLASTVSKVPTPTIDLNDTDGIVDAVEVKSWVGVTGTAFPGSRVELISTLTETGGSMSFYVDVDADGKWSMPYDGNNFPDGTYALSFRTLHDGNQSDEVKTTLELSQIKHTPFKITADGGKYYIDGVLTPELELVSGHTYQFDLSDSSLKTHPLWFNMDGSP